MQKNNLSSGFSGFPVVIARIIADYCALHTLLDWISADMLDLNTVYTNPHLFRDNSLLSRSTLAAMTINQRIRIASDRRIRIVENPMYADLIKANRHYVCNAAWKNPAILDWLLESGEPINWLFLAQNPCEKAVKMTLLNPDREYDQILSKNPAAIDWLRANPELINKNTICGNPAAIDIIKEMLAAGEEINYLWLCANPHPWVIEHLRLNQEKIAWRIFSTNPSIFVTRTEPALIAQLAFS